MQCEVRVVGIRLRVWVVKAGCGWESVKPTLNIFLDVQYLLQGRMDSVRSWCLHAIF